MKHLKPYPALNEAANGFSKDPKKRIEYFKGAIAVFGKPKCQADKDAIKMYQDQIKACEEEIKEKEAKKKK